MSSTLGSQRKLIEILLIFLTVFSALLFRRYDAFTNPQLWAEDGTVFLQQYINSGTSSLFMPYAGYLHTIPRMVVFMFGGVNLSHIPLCYNMATFIIVLLVAYSLWQSASYLGLNNRILYATAFLFLPIGAEMFMNITNIIWFTALYLVNFIFIGHKHGNKYLNILFVLLAGLTGPFSLLLSPIVLLLILTERKNITREKLIPFLLILTCGVIQLYFIKQAGKIARGMPGDPESIHLLRLFTNNVSDVLFLNSGYLPEMSPLKKLALSLVALGYFVYLFFNRYMQISIRGKFILIITPIVFLGSFIAAFWPNESKVLALNCPRYYFIPYACIAWVFILSYDQKIKIHHIAIYMAFFLLQSKREISSFPDKHWKEEVLQYKNGQRQDIDINPEGWKVTLPPKK